MHYFNCIASGKFYRSLSLSILLITTIACGPGEPATPDSYVAPTELSIGLNHACALVESSIVCWGDDPEDRSSMAGTMAQSYAAAPTIFDNNAAVNITTGDAMSCFIDELNEKVNCWGVDLKAPLEPTPTHLSAGAQHVCATFDTGVQCWVATNNTDLTPSTTPELSEIPLSAGYGYEVYAFNSIPSLVSLHPSELVSGLLHSCVIDDPQGNATVKCWGLAPEGFVEQLAMLGINNLLPVAPAPNTLSNPTRIAAANFHTCALDDNGVSCWGAKNTVFDYGQLTPPPLNMPFAIATSPTQSCALDADGIQCWGQGVAPPTFDNPTQLVMGVHHACVVEQRGVICWSHNESVTNSGGVANAVPEMLINGLDESANQ